MKATIDFYDMTTLRYLVIKEKFEQMWVIAPYFVWVAVSEALLFWVIVGGALFWVGRGGWGNILGGWVGVSWGEWGWVHCLIMPKFFLWLVLQGLCLRWIVWWLSMAKMMNLMQIMQVVNGLVDSASEIQYGLLNLIFWYEFVDLLVGPSICTKFSWIYNHQFK